MVLRFPVVPFAFSQLEFIARHSGQADDNWRDPESRKTKRVWMLASQA
jgi:hypothetical protein